MFCADCGRKTAERPCPFCFGRGLGGTEPEDWDEQDDPDADGAPVAQPRENAVKAAAWCAAALAAFIWLLTESVRVMSVMTGQGEATAQVIDTSDEEREANDGRQVGMVTVAAYEFSVRGHRYQGSTEGALGAWEKGDHLSVTYDDDNPNNNRAKGDRAPLGNLLLFALFGLPFSYLTLKLNVPILLREWAREAHEGSS
jgi:hypothetical protein